METKWYSIGNNEHVICCNCNSTLSSVGGLDHHPQECPICHIICIFYEYKGLIIQIINDKAPSALNKFIDWSQRELDELEFVELISIFEELELDIKRVNR